MNGAIHIGIKRTTNYREKAGFLTALIEYFYPPVPKKASILIFCPQILR
jgi:hypothetical protein